MRAVVANVPVAEAGATLSAMVGSQITWATCPHCQQTNALPGILLLDAFVYERCGRGVASVTPVEPQ